MKLLRFIARIGSIASIGLLAAFAFGGEGYPRFSELAPLLFFPIGVGIGMIYAWRDETIGGSITVASLAGFYAWMMARDGQFPRGPYFLLFALPGLLFLFLGLFDRPEPSNKSTAGRFQPLKG